MAQAATPARWRGGNPGRVALPGQFGGRPARLGQDDPFGKPLRLAASLPRPRLVDARTTALAAAAGAVVAPTPHPELAIGLAGDDLLLADRGLFFLYPGFAQGNDEPRLLFEVPQARRSIENPPAVFTTPDQRVCLLSRGQFFEWREARIQPLPFPVGKDLPADPAQPTSAAPGTIVWLERETLCEGRLDSGEIRSHSLDGLAEGPYLKLQALDGGWLLLAPWLEPHRSRDLAQLWHLESGRALRIRYGELDLEGGLRRWAELPDGRIVVGDHARHVDLGRFESLRQRLLRRRLAPA